MAEGTVYIVNIDFDGGSTGEYITADPTLVQDWVEANFISEVDERGERVVRGESIGDDDLGLREVTEADVHPTDPTEGTDAAPEA